MCVRQCKYYNKNLKEAACHLQYIKEENKDLFNKNYYINELLVEDMLILLYNTKFNVNMFVK